MKLQEVGKLSGGRQSCCEPEANVRVAAAPFGQPPAAGGPTKLAGGGGRVQAPARHQLDGLLLLCERANELAQKEEQLRRERQLDAGGWRHCDQAQEQEQGSGDEEQEEEEEEEEEEDGKSSLGPRQTAKTRTIFSCMWPNCTKNCDSIEAIECHVRHHLGLMQYDHTYGDEDFYYEETEVDEPTYFAIFRAQQPAAPMASDGRGHHQSQQAMSPSQHSDGFSSAQSPASSSSPAGSPRNCPPASAAAAAAAPSAPPQPPIESVAGGSQTATATAAGVPPCRLATLADLSAHRRKWPAPPIEIGRDQRRHHHHHQHHQLQQQQQAAADRPIDWAHFLGSNPKRPQGGELAAAAAAANDQETMMLMLMMSQKKRQLNGAYKGAAGATGRRPSASSSASSLESAGSSLSSASAALISASSSRRHSTRSASRHKRHRCHEASCGSDEEQDEDDEEEDEEEEQQQQQSCDGQQDDELGVRHNSEQQTAADSLWALQFPMELADGRDDTTPPTSPPQVPPARDSTAGRQSYCAAIEHAYCSPPANADEPPPPLPPPPQLERRARKQPQPKHQQLQPKAAPNSSGQNQRLRRQPMEVAHDNHHHLHLRLLSTHHKQQHHHQHQQFFQQIKPNYTNTISSYSSTSGNTKACGKLLIDSIDVNTSNNNNKHNDIGNSNLSLLGGSKTATSTASTHHHRIKSASHSSNSDSWSEDSAASSSAASEAPSSSPPQSASKRVRGENKKCRKVYGMEQRGLWCTQCKWKKACSRFCD